MARDGDVGVRTSDRVASRRLAVVTGLALVVPVAAMGPARADLPPVAPTPVIALGEGGSIEALGSVVCESDGTVEKVCEPVPLDGLGDAQELLLTAVPATAGDTPEWDPETCPDAVAGVCSLPVTALLGSTPLAPVVTFLPGSGDTGGGTDPGSNDPGTTDPGAGSGTADPGTIDTTITRGPRNNAWLLRRSVSYTFTSSHPDARFDCYVGSRMAACDTGKHRIAVWKLRRGTHRFTVESFTFDGDRDTSPAGRSFNVPLDDRALGAHGRWQSMKVTGHFKNTVRETKRKGATLVTKGSQRFRRVVLVADKGRGHGTVRVYWNQRLLGQVSLRAKRAQKARAIPVKRFSGKIRRGTIRVVVASRGKTVRIDGLGVASR